MPAPSSEPLLKITLNLFEADILTMKAIYGPGYQGHIRDIVHQYLRDKVRGTGAPTQHYLEEDFDE